ncbi:MAG: hypothetical protein LBF38_12880 [Deltaproteobacteria bacterium]|jgi:hypothetical protein|nr:hypothetical protein [Deltaproteobacteria bacterium]
MKPKKGFNKHQVKVITELDKLARKCGVKIFTGKLVYAGLKIQSGNCRLHSDNCLVIDRGQPYEEQLDLYRQVLLNVEIQPKHFDELSQETKSALNLGLHKKAQPAATPDQSQS